MISSVLSFAPQHLCSSRSFITENQVFAETTKKEQSTSSQSEDPNEIVARRIIVKGDVQGGYYRACVLNEVCIDNNSEQKND
jgi:hypothetical protein